MNIPIQPQPARNPEAGMVYTPTSLLALRDVASRKGTTGEFNELVSSLASYEGTAQPLIDAGVDFEALKFGRHDRASAIMNHLTLQQEDPVDADFGGLSGMRQVILPDPPSDGSQKLANGPFPPPTSLSIPGPSRPPEVYPFTLIGRDGHIMANVPDDLRAALGSLPDDRDMGQSFESLLQADFTSGEGWGSSDLDRGLRAVLGDSAAFVDAKWANGGGAAAEPDGTWAETIGNAIQNWGSALRGDFNAQLGDPKTDLARIEADTAPYADFRPSQLLMLIGARMRVTGREQGTNVGTTEQIGDQLPGARRGNVGRLQAQEYRAMLHQMRRDGQIGFSEGMINSIPENQLITQLERMQVVSANFRREAVLQSKQMWADLAVTLPTMVMGGNALAANLAIPKFVATRLGPVGQQAMLTAMRVGGHSFIGGAHGFAVADGPHRTENALWWGAGEGAFAAAGPLFRASANAVTKGKYLAFDNLRFRARVKGRMVGNGMDPGFADIVATSFDDWHAKRWVAQGNAGAEAALKDHVIERNAAAAVRKALGPNATEEMVAETQKALMEIGNLRAKAVKMKKAFDKSIAQGVLVVDSDPVFAATLPGMVPPQALKDGLQKLIGSGKTIDRKKYQALLAYLEKAQGGVPSMQAQLDEIVSFLKNGTTQADGLKAIAADLQAAGQLNGSNALSALKKELLTFKASVKAFEENLARENAAKLQQARDILTAAQAELKGLDVEWQKWIKRDPLEHWEQLNIDRDAAMDHFVPKRLESLALQHRENFTTARNLKRLAAGLEVRLASAGRKLDEAVRRQQVAIDAKIEAATARVRAIREGGLEARIDDTIESELEYLTAEREVAIREAKDATQREWNAQDGVFKRSTKPEVQYRVNDAKQRIINDRRQWVDWIEEQYRWHMDDLASDAHREELRRELPQLVSDDLTAAIAERQALIERRASSEARIRASHDKYVTKLQQELDDTIAGRNAADEDVAATAMQMQREGIEDANAVARRAAKVDEAYAPRIKDAWARAEAELADPNGKRPPRLTADEGAKLREAWFRAKKTAAEIRRGVDEAAALGREVIEGAQDDLLRAVTKDLSDAEGVAAKFDELVGKATRRSDGEGLWRMDRLIRDAFPGQDGINIFGRVPNTFDEASFPLGHTSIPTAVRGEVLGKLRQVAKAMSDLSVIWNPSLRVGRRKPAVLLRLAERVAGVARGTYRSLTDIPLNVAQHINDTYAQVMEPTVNSWAKQAVRTALGEAAVKIGNLRGNLSDDVADTVATLSAADIAKIELESGLPVGTLTERPLISTPKRILVGLEEAFGLKEGTLTKASSDLSIDGLTAIEKANGMEPGALTTAKGRLKLIQGVASLREIAVREMKSAGYAQKLAMLNDPEFAAGFAARNGKAFSPGRVARVAAEMGLDPAAAQMDGPVRTQVIARLGREIIDNARNGFVPDARGILGHLSNFVNNQLHEPFAARYLLHNFMLLDEVLGGMGMDITPLLDDIRRSVVREKELDHAVTDGVSEFFKGVEMLHAEAGSVTREQQRQVNELVTHYRLANENPSDAKYTMDQVLAAAEKLGVKLTTLQETAARGSKSYGNYLKFMKDSGYDIGVVEGYASKVEKGVPGEQGPPSMMARIYSKFNNWFTKQRTEGELPNREYDALVLAQRYHEAVKREHVLGDVIRKSKDIENTLREMLASADNPNPRIVRTYSDVVNYAQGIGRKSIPDLPGLRSFFRNASRMNALRLTSPKTAAKQFADPFVITGQLAPKGRFWEYAKVVANNMVHVNDPRWGEILGYLERDGIGGGDYRVWDNYGFQSQELMMAAQHGVAIRKSSWIDTKLIHFMMSGMHFADQQGRITAAAVGEEISTRALKSIPKDLPTHEAFAMYTKEVSKGFLSKGQWDSVYLDFARAYEGGDQVALRQSMGKKVSSTVMFDYFPGSGSSITRNPYLRQAIPFYSYAGARNMLLARSIARNEGMGSLYVSALFEGTAFAARWGVLGKGMASELSLLGGLPSYMDYMNTPFSPNYDKDKTNLRSFLEVAGGPGVGGLGKMTYEMGALVWQASKLPFTDMNKIYEIAVDGMTFPNKDRKTKGDVLVGKAKIAAAQLSDDMFEVFVRGIGLTNYTRGAIEGVTDLWMRDERPIFSEVPVDNWIDVVANKAGIWTESQDLDNARRQAYSDELTYYQMITYNFVKSSSKPLTDKTRAAIKESLGVDIDATESKPEILLKLAQVFGNEFRRQLVVGRGVISQAALEGGAP